MAAWPRKEPDLRGSIVCRRRAAANTPRGQETGAAGAPSYAAHGGLRRYRATMLRLPRAAHYSICDSLCAHDTACLSETASQWNQKDDPRHAALHACVADRVARAWGVASRQPLPTSSCNMGNVVPGKTLASMLKFLEAVEWPKVHGNGKIMEQITYYAPARLPVSVEGHEDIDGRGSASIVW